MSWVAIAIAGSSLVGAGVSLYSSSQASSAASKASDAQAEAMQKGIDAQLEMFYRSREDLAPWREIGLEALGALRTTLGLSAIPSQTLGDVYSPVNTLYTGTTQTTQTVPSATGTTQTVPPYVKSGTQSTIPTATTPSSTTQQAESPIHVEGTGGMYKYVISPNGSRQYLQSWSDPNTGKRYLVSKEWNTGGLNTTDILKYVDKGMAWEVDRNTGEYINPNGTQATTPAPTTTPTANVQNALYLPSSISQLPATGWSDYVMQNSDLKKAWEDYGKDSGKSIDEWGREHYIQYGYKEEGRKGVPSAVGTTTQGGYTMPPGTSPDEYIQSPYYNFLLDEGIKAQTRYASATGKLDSGESLKDVQRFAQGLASTDYQNYLTNWLNTVVNPQLAVAGMGQVSTGQGANLANQTGAGLAQSYMYGGNAQAQGYINQANAATGGATSLANSLNQGVNNYLFYDFLGKRYPGATGYLGGSGAGGY